MTAGTLSRLPGTVLAERPVLDRETRRELLEWLAAEGVNGLHPVPAAGVPSLVREWASPSLTAAQAAAKWDDLMDETDRLAAVRSGEPYLDIAGVDEDMCAGDRLAALSDLLDGTSTYRGTR